MRCSIFANHTYGSISLRFGLYGQSALSHRGLRRVIHNRCLTAQCERCTSGAKRRVNSNIFKQLSISVMMVVNIRYLQKDDSMKTYILVFNYIHVCFPGSVRAYPEKPQTGGRFAISNGLLANHYPWQPKVRDTPFLPHRLPNRSQMCWLFEY